MKYEVVPKEIKLSEVFANGFCLSPLKYKSVEIKNNDCLLLRDLLDRELRPSDKGVEVGSQSYITKSPYFFIRTKSLQRNSFLPSFTSESVTSILPASFKSYNLRADDLLISKDSNIGEAIILDRDYLNYMISGGIYKLPVSQHKYYLFAFLKSNFFRTQLDLLAPKGVTIRHAKKLFLECKIPFPNQKNAKVVIEYIVGLVQSVIEKEKEIARKNELTIELIEKELVENQKPNSFIFEYPNSTEIGNQLRIDAGYYCESHKRKQFMICNYAYGAKPIKEYNYGIKRGQNLQISCIGKSIYSDELQKDFYTLIRPTNFSEYGTAAKYEYLGNPQRLSFLESGDIVFSAEGTIGKCVLFVDLEKRTITNIHGIVLKKKDHKINESAFIACFLRFLRYWGFFDYISVGGQGGSLVMKYWDEIFIPNFKNDKQKEIARLYYNPVKLNLALKSDLEQFMDNDSKWNEQAGIIQLDESAKKIKKRLEEIAHQIVMDEEVDIDFSFLE